jgi:tRNA(Ile)-lysidine synthase
MIGLSALFKANWPALKVDAGRPVLLALSGGLDSMALAQLLIEAEIPFAAAHCNFSLRDAESDGDEAFIREWSAAQNVTLHVKRFDTKQQAGAGQSIQMAARELRYEWFEELRTEYGYAAILTAHHAGDLAETVLINLVRGTGLGGLQGIPMRNGAIVRPLLFADRAAIEAYAISKGLSWREDSSNASDKYLRNAIRHNVLPVLEELMPGAGKRIAESARRVAGSLPLYRGAIDKIMKRLIEARGRDFYVPLLLLKKQAQLDTIVYELFQPFGFGGEYVPAILSLMDAPSGRFLQSDTHRIIRDRAFLIVTAADPAEADLIRVDHPEAVVQTRRGELRFALKPAPEALPDDRDIAILDARDIRFPLVLRSRREGDYFYPLGMGGKKKKLKRFLIDIKMPQPEKERVLVLEQEGKVLWIVGSRIDERFRVRPDTTEVLEVRIIRGD